MPTHPSTPRPKSNTFGSSINTRSFSVGSGFRFGFNGKEKQGEIDNNDYDFGARVYDGRLGRWFSVDPLNLQYPDLTPFNFCSNNSIFFIDIIGLEIVPNENFKGTNYEKIFNFLTSNVNTFTVLLEKFVDINNHIYKLNLETVDDMELGGKGGSTINTYQGYSYKDNGVSVIEFTEVNSHSKFMNSRTNDELTIWHMYLVVHEATHSAEIFSTLIPSKNNSHENYISIRNKNIEVWNEINKKLDLKISEKDINILSFAGAEDTEAFANYIKEQATSNGTTIKFERNKYEDRKQELFEIEIPLIPKDEISPKSE